MRVEVPLRMRRAIRGPLVKAHGVRERRRKNVVVARGQTLQNVGQAAALGFVEFVAPAMAAGLTDHAWGIAELLMAEA